MALWLWLNLGLGALFVLAIVGIPLWLVMTRPDTAPAFAELPAWRRAREHRAQQAAAQQAAAQQAAARQAAAQAAAGSSRLYQTVGQRWGTAAGN